MMHIFLFTYSFNPIKGVSDLTNKILERRMRHE